MSNLPLTSAICLTRNRREFLKIAIQRFLDQTYERKELVVVNDTDADGICDLLPVTAEIVHVTLPKMNIGAKRAAAVKHCRGDILINFDDDDISSPDRISDQVGRLLESGKQVTGYHSFKAQDEKGNVWKYVGQDTYACGSSLCYWKTFAEEHPFESLMIGEDNLFVATANRLKQLISVDAEDRLIAGIHSGNTDRKRVECPPWKKIS